MLRVFPTQSYVFYVMSMEIKQMSHFQHFY